MDLNALETFVAVVRAGGFSAAAREIDMPRSSISLRIKNLEKSLGVRLFKRSTRSFSLTFEGHELYSRSAEAIDALKGAVDEISKPGFAYNGEIRVTVPADFPARIVAAAISDFRREHAAVRFEIISTNEVLDIIGSNIDIALRIGNSNPQDALVRHAIDMSVGLYASRAYLEVTGTPKNVSEIIDLIGPQRPVLRKLLASGITGSGALPSFRIVADSFRQIRELVLLTQGIGLLPSSLCRAEGTMVPVLHEQLFVRIPLCLNPSRADLSPKVSAFARSLANQFNSGNSSKGMIDENSDISV